MDKLVEHTIKMLEIVDNERGFYKDMDGDVADIARAVYDVILRVQLLEYKAYRKTENSSEKPNNCEHITEDGVTCAKYPACDDCLDNPLNKVKGSERLVKGKVEPTISKMEQVDKDINVRSKDEPQNDLLVTEYPQDGEVNLIGRDKTEAVVMAYDTYKELTEPQTNKDFKVTYTCSFTDCDNFKNFGFGEKCIECKRKQSEAKYKDEPQTEEWYTYQDEQEYNDRWQTDEPQTDCSWQKGE